MGLSAGPDRQKKDRPRQGRDNKSDKGLQRGLSKRQTYSLERVQGSQGNAQSSKDEGSHRQGKGRQSAAINTVCAGNVVKAGAASAKSRDRAAKGRGKDKAARPRSKDRAAR